jgi:5-methylcytosine-specific restriction endonuclease McrBC GTP-binding regulatory subunit McrB
VPNPRTPADVALKALGSPLQRGGDEALRLLDSGRNVILYGPPGTGKTHISLGVRQEWLARHGAGSVVLTTFHPSYSYEDFVEGFRPDLAHPEKFILSDGILLRAAEAAKRRPVLLVIDEINRADVARVFGELITFIERDKRGLKFYTAQNRRSERSIPGGLYVLGTMNTADKSISLLDVALRRRFVFVPCPPEPQAYASVPGWATDVEGVALGDLLAAINRRLLAVGVERDRLVGHAILAVPTGAGLPDLTDRLRYDLVPLVEEYLFSDLDRVTEVLPGLVDSDGQVKTAMSSDDLRELAGLQSAAASSAAAADTQTPAGTPSPSEASSSATDSGAIETEDHPEEEAEGAGG